MPAIYRFARDLRLEDHAGLTAAAEHGEVIPLLVIDRAMRTRLESSPRRAAFFCSAAEALDGLLRERESALVVRMGEAPDVIGDLVRETGATAVVWSASYDRTGMENDVQLQAQLEERGIRASVAHDAPAIPPEETSAQHTAGGRGYRAFAPYYDVWRTLDPASFEAPLLLSFARARLRSDPLPFAPDAAAGAGPNAARTRFEQFLRVDATQYSFALNVPADDRTSHLSADLTFGTISARAIVRETRARLDDPFLLSEERVSLRLFLRSIAMRDFFLQLAFYHPQMSEEPLQEKMRAFEFAETHPQLDAWREGRTGYPLVDAGIRQLHAIGWMHPRVRAIAASFLCFDLGVHWRAGVAEWDRYLIEDDPAIAIGNWQWIAGVGADLAAYPRIYNPQKQARRFDPAGAYARRWIPELEQVSPALGARRAPSPQLTMRFQATPAYPEPAVDHETAAREFLRKYQAFAPPRPAADRRASR